MPNILHLISNINLNTTRKKKEAYFLRRKNCDAILNILWKEKLIWGYEGKNVMIKIYFKYCLSKSVISSVKLFRIKITLKKLILLIKNHPQSLFIIKTTKGYRTSNDCVKQNISGILILKIN